MQHGEDAQRAADPLAIRGERLDRRGGFTKQGGIDEPLVRASHRPELVRQREREEVMIARQQSRAKAGEPILSPVLLAFGAVPVATRVVAVVERTAVVTAVERSAEGRGAAGDNLLHGTAV